ncbi:MAG: alpha/beta fold hydrolase [Pseudomonadota bacterium]
MQLAAAAIDNTPEGRDASTAGVTPVIFLHGFGGLAAQWRGLRTGISFKAPTYALDLPGHGGSLDWPGFGPPKVAAKAVLAFMSANELENAHIVGHSMGGAVASLVGLMEPGRVASLTLLAPGGFGAEFNHPLLLRWAAAQTRDELRDVMASFFGPDYVIEDKVIEFQYQARQRPGAIEALVSIAEGMSSDGKQGMLPVDDLLATGLPISMIWGTEDKVLPVSQGLALKDRVDLHIAENTGHSPAEEQPQLVQAVILSQLKAQ